MTQLLAVFSYSCLNIYNSPYTNVRFLPVTATYVLLQDMEKLCDRLLEVCNKGVEPSKNHSMDKLCRGLVRLTSTRYIIRACVCACICMYVYVCMYVCMYVSMYMYVCMYVCMYVRMYVCMYVYMYVSMYMYVCMYVCM